MSEAVIVSPEFVDVVPEGAVATTPAPDAIAGDADGGLTDLEREILAFERKWWRFAGAKEEAMRAAFDLTSTRYYQVLNALIDRPAAMAQDPALVKRLRRMRATRQGTRSAQRLADEKA
ncbi:DUF3263 domain-containing protein [Myceligenerans crystallogenes]|uniref:DUF3263 domain-containing protein n=1 Tax=Myceligenerans crystallogenes TaxID=316335 RepID=A0ABN2NBF0_9MICO